MSERKTRGKKFGYNLRTIKIKRDYPGQSMLEFTLVFPIILLIIFGIIEFSRVIFTYTAVSMASREGARYGASVGVNAGGTEHYLDCAGVRTATRRIGGLVGVQDADITVYYDHGPDTGQFATCPAIDRQISLGDRIVVEVHGAYSPLPVLPLVGLRPFQMNSISNRTIIKDIDVANAPTPGGG
jgi:uncharacterized protein (UPF0333 family)